MSLVTCLCGYAQEFSEKWVVTLPDTVGYERLDWVDADNDSLLDLLISCRNGASEAVLFLYANDTINGFAYAGHVDTGVIASAFLPGDFDGDNIVDVTISGMRESLPGTFVFQNRGDFQFEARQINEVSAAILKLADFNEDGSRELLLSGREGGLPFVRIMEEHTSGWTTIYDSISIEASAIEVINFDGDVDLDFFINGVDENGETVTRVYYNEGAYYFTHRDLTSTVNGESQGADLDHDGNFDVLLCGKDGAGIDHVVKFLNSGATLTAKDSVLETTESEVFAADLNSDGQIDLHSFGYLPGGDTLSVIVRASGLDTLVHKHVIRQAFGDFDRDGDLDLALLTKVGTTFRLNILTNNTEERNAAPLSPGDAVAARIFDRVFLSWRVPLDDHTPPNSLTYDVNIYATGANLMTAEFDMMSGQRMTVTHGNNKTVPYILIRKQVPGPFNFSIQSVDNSFHAGLSGVCTGSGGEGTGCSGLEFSSLEACKNETLILSTKNPSDWYSFREGFLERTDALTFSVLQADTLFSVEPAEGCTVITVYTIAVPDVLIKRSETTRYVCEGARISLGVENTWSSVEWTSSLTGILSHDDSLEYVVTAPDTVTVNISDGIGCQIQRSTILQVSKPVVTAIPEAYQILQGESVQLNVSGGLSYQWTPRTGLDDAESATPIATPVKTTQYQVQGKDSLGCNGSAQVVVIVEQTAFVPNLFTPNRDGSNDALKIYGLGSAVDFSFTIFNREGTKVFQTNDLSEASNVGWDGTAAGVDQPAGLYYWNIKGVTSDGNDLRLNGKYSGSLVLLR